MSYTLECYALKHDDLRGLIGSGRTEVAQEIIDAADDLFGDDVDEDWQEALHALIDGPRGRTLAQSWVNGASPDTLSRPPEASEAEAIAVAAMIRFLGEFVGSLQYSSRGGDLFRAIFDPAFAPPQFATPRAAPLLLHRPIVGVVHSDYPSWGGWTLAEIRAALGGRAEPAAAPGDDDQAEWLQELHDVLVDVLDDESDLVTLCL